MKSFNWATASATCLAALLAGCTAAPTSSAPTPSPSSTTAVAKPMTCTDLNDYPQLPVDRLIAELPLNDLDPISFSQSELSITRGQGSCADQNPQPVATECSVLTGTLEGTEDIMLWRPAGTFIETLFAEDAERLLTVEITGDGQGGGWFFKYRMTAVDFASPDDAAQSTLLSIVQACQAAAERPEDTSGQARLVLRDGDEPSLVALTAGSRIILVEPRIITVDGRTGRYPDTTSGLLPDVAVDKMIAWFQENLPA